MKYFGFILSVSLSLYAGINNLYAQKAPKFGKIDFDNLNVNSCPIDSNAHAYYIFDYGDATISGNKLFYERHFCIKIVDSKGYSSGNIRIPLFHGGGEEKLTKLKAVTYNMENGQLIQSELDAKDKFLEKESEYWNAMKFALPNLKAGSIIEVKYIIRSDYFYNIPTWFFQHKIPTLYSQYVVTIPEFYHYSKTVTGYYPVSYSKTDKNDHLGRFPYRSDVFHYSADSVPSFPVEGYLRTIDNYLTKVTFELEAYESYMGPVTHFTSTWKDIDDDLLDSEYFGQKLKRTKYIKELAESLQRNNPDRYQLMNRAFQHIRNRMSWNGFSTKYINTTLKEAYKNKTGNSADINLNLVRLLRAMGYLSYPVILSTQDNGIINPTHPSVTAFNYVIAMVVFEGKSYLMDATDKDAEINLLPVRCLNDRGRVIGNFPDKWINLMNYKSYVEVTNYVVTTDSDLNFNVKVSSNLKDYGAYMCQKEMEKFNDLTEYKKSLEDSLLHTSTESFDVHNNDSVAGKLNITYHLKIENQENIQGNLLYFVPVINPFFKKNPFPSDNREFPVEFNYPYRIMQVQSYQLPADFVVKELPKGAKFVLPDNSAQFIYQVKQLNNFLIVSSLVTINKSIFLPDEYNRLKQFFQLMIDKQHELVVLKRNDS